MACGRLLLLPLLETGVGLEEMFERSSDYLAGRGFFAGNMFDVGDVVGHAVKEGTETEVVGLITCTCTFVKTQSIPR